MNKEALLIAHNNTHSTSRIFRNIDLIRKEDANSSIIEKRLQAIDTSAQECRKQVDDLYLIVKDLYTQDDLKKAIELATTSKYHHKLEFYSEEEIIEQLKKEKK